MIPPLLVLFFLFPFFVRPDSCDRNKANPCTRPAPGTEWTPAAQWSPVDGPYDTMFFLSDQLTGCRNPPAQTVFDGIYGLGL